MSTTTTTTNNITAATAEAQATAADALRNLEAGKITIAAAWADRSAEWALRARRIARETKTREDKALAKAATVAAASAQPAIQAWKARRAQERRS